MRFAINYSPEAEKLLAEGKIQIDLFKLPDWPDLTMEISAKYPSYVHFALQAGNDPDGPVDWDFIERTLEQTETALVNVHLGVPQEMLGDDVDILDSSEAVRDDVTERMARYVDMLVGRFGKERVIAENLFCLDRESGLMHACTRPDVIHEVITATGCGLLLDMTHATIAAFTHGLFPQDYIAALPVGRLREVHVTGIGFRDDGRIGDHLEMRDKDWKIYEWMMTQVHENPDWREPDIVASEYGGIGAPFRLFTEEAVIAADTPRMYRAVHRQPQVAG